jgi:hypothetical protein
MLVLADHRAQAAVAVAVGTRLQGAEVEVVVVERRPLVDPRRSWARDRGAKGTRIPPGIHSTAGGAATANGAARTCKQNVVAHVYQPSISLSHSLSLPPAHSHVPALTRS